ncbi:MAG: FkbM family methyltransferase [Candidatus Hydrogenedentota bacterium]|nr:MAG: FkbM family methyltransferase [Candidatus Hydrogenedentota bacterium]
MWIFANEIRKTGGICFLDIGSGWQLSERWKAIEPLISLWGFDPNPEECKRLEQNKNSFLSARYLPYALSDQNGRARLFVTKSGYCDSLLEPNTPWLSRFSYKRLFDVVGRREIETVRLDHVPELQEVDVDIIKSDTQGMELPILSKATRFLNQAFYVETETGFLENYYGETTYSQIDEFMRSRGFLLFDMRIHRMTRDNPFKDLKTTRGQILWCEAVWLKDYLALETKGSLDTASLTRRKAIRALTLCALQKTFDFGLELARFFHKKCLLDDSEMERLERPETWMLPEDSVARW